MQPNVSAKKLSDILGMSLTVPDYQRPYSWEATQVSDFISDTLSFVRKHPGDVFDDYYLFGQIIIHISPTKADIVDGQQRLITSTIFLCAIRDLSKNNEGRYSIGKVVSNSIDNCIGIYDPDTNESNLKLKAGSRNQAFFLKYIQQGDHTVKPESESDQLIKSAYETIIRSIQEEVNKGVFLSHIAKGFLDCFYVSYMETDDLKKAFLVFETLNSRGQPLEIQDLLKSHFFSLLDDSNYYMKEKWEKMVDKIDSAGGDVARFIRYYWNSFNEHTREKELFGKISDLDLSESIAFMEGLVKYSGHYVSMVNFKVSSCFENNVKDILKNLRDVGATSFFPLIFAIYKSGNADRLYDVLRVVEILIFRNQVIMKKTANINEVFFCDQAYLLSTKSITVDEVITNIINTTEDDEVIKPSFLRFKPTAKVARTILFDLYKFENPGLTLIESKVQLEHIMPQTKGPWVIDEEEWKEYSKRFGNMTLLYGVDNSKIKNKTYAEKRKIAYLGSKISDTKQIALDYESEWTPADIEKRQADLFIRFVTRWNNGKKIDCKQSKLM